MRASRPSDVEDYFKVVGDFRLSAKEENKRESRMLLQGKDGSPDNYMMGLSNGVAGAKEDPKTSGWTSPRHRHTFEQIRHTLEGEYMIRKDEYLPAGWVAYFPQSAYYGPQVKANNLKMITLQFGGPSGLGYWSMQKCREAFAALEKQGRKFKDGVCTWTDETGKVHNQDASETVEAYARGHEVDYPELRYKDIIMMNPAAFSWVKDREQAGIGRKHLGSFTERDVRVSFIRADKGATLQFGTESSAEVLFLKEGKVTHDNNSYDKHSAFSAEPEDKPVGVTAIEPSEFFYIKLPNF